MHLDICLLTDNDLRDVGSFDCGAQKELLLKTIEAEKLKLIWLRTSINKKSQDIFLCVQVDSDISNKVSIK